MTLYFRRRLLFRVLALLMMFLILALVSVVPVAQAFVLESAIAYGSVEIIATILISCGIVAANADNIRDIAYEVYVWLGEHASAVLSTIADWVVQKATSVFDVAVRVSLETVDVIRQAVNELTATDANGNKVVSTLSLPAGVPSYADFINECIPQMAEHGYIVPSNLYVPDCVMYFNGSRLKDTILYLCVDSYLRMNSEEITGARYLGYAFKVSEESYESSNKKQYFYYGDSYWFVSGGLNQKSTNLSFPFESLVYCSTDIVQGDVSVPASGVSIPYTGTVADPREDTMIYVPDIPEVQTDEEGKDVVIWPDLSLNPDDFVLDIPKTATGDLVDVPYDTLVDASTGTAVGEGEGTGTGEGEGTGSGILDILGDIWDAIRNFFDSPSDFKLDFDGFKNLILVDRFPFCIPFDLRDAIMLFAASAADYKFSIDLDTAYFSVHHTVDLSPYTVPITFFRYVVVVWFVYVLILRTRDVMKW